MSRVLFKFCSSDSAVNILEGHSLFVTSPLDLNDPFEMRPGWTDEHEKRFCADQELRSRLTADLPPEKPTLVDSHRGIADSHNQRVFRELHSRFRVLSLVSDLFNLADGEGQSDEDSTLMWSHYADQFQGICLALDASKLDNGMRCGGFPVEYKKERQYLPPSYYDCYQSLLQPTCGTTHKLDPAFGLYLTPGEQSAAQEREFLKLLTHKSPAWQHEREVRMIYDLPKLRSSPQYRNIPFPCEVCRQKERPATECQYASYRDAIDLPPGAVRAVIFGADCPLQDVQRVFDVLSGNNYHHVETYWSCLDSSKYVVQYVKGNRAEIERTQQQLADYVARAKNHWQDGQLRLARKGINYVQETRQETP